ncbi:C10 family peptidase [Mangrovivirga sp. M17]|uniref:C10 family peptidase n=1 Tax=Mangrovivirga halotolerans TaxID=2993936 RepID=A0ABT3RQY6_9BACT|nr:C10 family peptidase [Mangrovivirga halotolerans]MCX2744046.1 C10 family peptidase [Mangrovivirga halotolerans]
MLKNYLLQVNRHSLMYLLLLIGIISCTEEQLEVNEIRLHDDQFIDLNEASSIASVLEYPMITDEGSANARLTKVPTTFKEIEEVLEVPDKKGKSAFYIINYKEGGFIILSADNRLEPIRAFSYDGKFPIHQKEISGGLISWLSQTKEMVSEARVLNQEETDEVSQSWNICEIQSNLRINPIEEDGSCGGDGGSSNCKNSYESKGPLMSTKWGQEGMFNTLVKYENCSLGTAPTGCVATAMAQVMRFHETPGNYNWSIMPDGQGSLETAKLMRDIGFTIKMEYSCESSGASMVNATNAFSSDFGYQVATYTSFNREQVIEQLRSDQPVILSGFRNRDQNGILCFMGWCSYSISNGHAWVTDGYRINKTCNYDDKGNLYSTSTYYFLYMNWGWDGNEDGFFKWNDWTPYRRNYQYHKEMIIKIKPRQ